MASMRFSYDVIVGLLLAMLLGGARPALSVTLDVTRCDQVVPAGATGLLRNDLDCPPDVHTVTLERNATLRMAGHTIRGGVWLSCSRCRILGPGAITGASECAIYTTENPTPADAALTARDLAIHDNSWCGIGVPGTLRLKRVRVANGKFGIIFVQAMQGTDVDVRETAVGIGCNATQACTTGQPDCLVRLRRLTAVDNGVGIAGCPVALRDSQVQRSEFSDLQATALPRLVRTICDRSMRGDATGPWGVCALDP